MKRDVKKIMIESKTIETYSDSRFEVVKALMKQAIKRDAWLKNYLSLDPLNKAQWCADHIQRLWGSLINQPTINTVIKEEI